MPSDRARRVASARAQVRKITLPGGVYDMNLVTHLEEHLLWMRRAGRSANTIYSRRRCMVIMAESLGMDPFHATVDDLERWQELTLRQVSIHQMRLNTVLSRPYYDYIHQRGYRADNPARMLALPPEPHRLPRPMAEDKVERMLAGPASPRVRCWLLLAGWVGLRAAEIAGMERENFFVDEHGQLWLTVIGKGNRQRNVAVPDWLWEEIEPVIAPEGRCWRRERKREACSDEVTAHHVSQYSNHYLHQLGIPDTLHSLRHRIATLLLERSGGDIRLVQTLLGHKDVASTSLYTLVSPTRLATAVSEVPAPTLARRHAQTRRARGRSGRNTRQFLRVVGDPEGSA